MRKDLRTELPEEHESYGVLGFSRATTHPPMALFGSNIKHGNIIIMTVKQASTQRGFQKDWVRGKERLIEVTMSATQFADAITSMNIGDGVPVTINYVKGDQNKAENHGLRESPPEMDFKTKAQGELKAEMKEIADRVDELSKDATEILKRSGPLKAADKEKLLKDLMFLAQEVRSNIPFAHECFTEAVERTVTEAKGEMDATYQAMRERLGDKAIQEHKLEMPLLNDSPNSSGV